MISPKFSVTLPSNQTREIFPSPFPRALLSQKFPKYSHSHNHSHQITKYPMGHNLLEKGRSDANWFPGRVQKIELTRSLSKRQIPDLKNVRGQGSARGDCRTLQKIDRQKSVSIAACEKKLKQRILQIIGGSSHTSASNFQTMKKETLIKQSRSFMNYLFVSREGRKQQLPQSSEDSVSKINNICKAKLMSVHSRYKKHERLGQTLTSTIVRVYNHNGLKRSSLYGRYRTQGNEIKPDERICTGWQASPDEHDIDQF